MRVRWYDGLTENDSYNLESIEPLKEDGSLDLDKLSKKWNRPPCCVRCGLRFMTCNSQQVIRLSFTQLLSALPTLLASWRFVSTSAVASLLSVRVHFTPFGMKLFIQRFSDRYRDVCSLPACSCGQALEAHPQGPAIDNPSALVIRSRWRSVADHGDFFSGQSQANFECVTHEFGCERAEEREAR